MLTINPSSLNFSETAINHFLSSLESRGKGAGIQIGIRPAGCSGYEYFLEFVDSIDADSIVFENNGCNVYVDKKSLDSLKGSLVDYLDDGLNKGIKFVNPNAKATCGCGESFTI